MTRIEFELSDPPIFIKLLGIEDAPALLDFYRTNSEFLKPWEPERPANFYSLPFMEAVTENITESARNDEAYSFGIFLNTTPQTLIGRITLNNVVRGVFQCATLGYALDQAYNGRGYTTRAVRLVMRFALRDLRLHRVQAGTLRHNYASMRVLEKVGFRREGLALRYLKIDGQWQDHYLFAITAEELVD